jgi:hypothetical protein
MQKKANPITNGAVLGCIGLAALIALVIYLASPAWSAVTIKNGCRVSDDAGDTIYDLPNHLGCLRGGGGIDRLLGYDGADKLDGQTGNRVLRKGGSIGLFSESDDLHGGESLDTFYVGPGTDLGDSNTRNEVAWIHDYENGEVICSNHSFGGWYLKNINGEMFVVAKTTGIHTVLARIMNWGTGKHVVVRPNCRP